jgi:hypothetical protein
VHSVHHGDRKGGPPLFPGPRHGYLQKALGHRVYRKLTHTNLYLNAGSHHHLSNKQTVLSTWVHRARAFCDGDSLHSELVFLRDIFRQNGYKGWQSHNVPNHRPDISKPSNRPISVAFLLYAWPIFSRISRVLARHNIKSVVLPHKKISRFLRPVKAILEFSTPGVYRIPCECGRVCIGQTVYSVDTRLREL